MDISHLSISQAHRDLISGKYSITELVNLCFGNIQKYNPKINAFITLCKDQALQEAGYKQQNIKKGQQVGPLYGIPLALKDLFSTKGIKTTAGSKLLHDYVPVYDATVVDRLKKAGAIIIGKTNCDAWAHGSSGENSDYLATHNPYNLDLTPGGSSSGSAASLASGMCLGATGTDTGGSIRLPASFCNLVGLKPTYGLVSRYGIIAMASSFDSIGHLTKTVLDSLLVLEITSGNDPKDSTSIKKPPLNYQNLIRNNVKGLKIGIIKEYFTKGISQEIGQLTGKAIKTLEKMGAEITEISLPHTEYAVSVYYIIQSSEVSSNLARFDGIRYGLNREEFGQEAKRRIMIGTFCLSSGYKEAYYRKAAKIRKLIITDFQEAYKKVDIIATPVSPTTAFKLGEKIRDPLSMYLSDIFTIPANIAGIPGLVVPCGFSKNNLPVGLQLLANYYQEHLLFGTGLAYEKETEYWKVKPKII